MKKFFLLFLLALAIGIYQPVAAELVKEEFSGAWKTMKIVDDMDDSVSYVACAVPVSADRSKLTRENKDYVNSLPKFYFVSSGTGRAGCFIKIPEAFFDTDVYAPPVFFQYRLDKDVPKDSDDWEGHQTNITLQREVQQFAQELYDHKTLVVRTRDKDGTQYTIKFNITGAKQALKDIAKAAGWQ